MKHSIKPAFLCLFAVLFSSCLPHEKLTGRVIDLTGPVPETAVLGILWIEDVDKAKPMPDTKDLKLEDRDAVLEKDMKDRGLPAAYTRTFADKNGVFTLDKLHFSAGTKKAIKAMKQPKITRATIWAFQRGYRKQAVTIFPKRDKEEIPDVTMMLARPADWKELYDDNIVDTLTQDYMLKGYSKEFGATKAEKSWIFEYTRANEQRAYDTSDIKGDKKMEEMCGHDYSDIIVSTAGIQRNPNHEKCGELLKRIGAIREVKELWIGHSNTKQDPLAATKEVVKQALNTLSAKTTEPKEYEIVILAGVEDAWKAQSKTAMRNGLNDHAWQDEAKGFYGRGDKAAAYRALGYELYSQLPDDIKQGVITAQLSIRTIPGIKDAVAGFHQLMNRPLTAQLPGGDNGNHKDKPGYKVEGSTKTEGASIKSGVSLDGNTKEAAQTASSATIAVSSKTKKIEVKDYKSFKEYVTNEEAKLRTKPVTTDNGPVRDKMKKMGIEFSAARNWVNSADGEKTAYISPNKNGVAVIDEKLCHVEIYDVYGKVVMTVPFLKYPKGVISFSDNRMFVLNTLDCALLSEQNLCKFRIA